MRNQEEEQRRLEERPKVEERPKKVFVKPELERHGSLPIGFTVTDLGSM